MDQNEINILEAEVRGLRRLVGLLLYAQGGEVRVNDADLVRFTKPDELPQLSIFRDEARFQTVYRYYENKH